MSNLWNEFSNNLTADEWSALYSAIHHQIEYDRYSLETERDPELCDCLNHRLETLENIWNKLGFE